MKLNKIYKEIIIESYQGHKIPVAEIFSNDNAHANGFNKIIDNLTRVYKDDDSFEEEPILNVPVDKIVPTQKFVSKSNLKDVKNNLKVDNTGAYLVKYGEFYYIIDGHHRISNRILRGDQSIKAFVHVV